MINFRFLIPLFLVILLFVVVLLNKISQIYDENREIIGWSRNTSRDLAVYIRPKQATTILESKICHDNNHPMLLLIVVCSAVKNFKARETIRETWGNTSYFNYQLFEKMHGIETASYLEVNSKDWRIYAKVKIFKIDLIRFSYELYNYFVDISRRQWHIEKFSSKIIKNSNWRCLFARNISN